MNTPALITQRPILRPKYATAETFEAWLKVNSELVDAYWRQLGCDDESDAVDFMEFAQTQYEVSNPDVADCDVCQFRPGTHTAFAAGIETWVCDKCSDIRSYMRPHHANAWQNRDADDAGQPAYGEL